MALPTVLVVEDELDLREATCSYLKLEGFDPFEADSISAAKALIEQEAIDVMVLDLGLGSEDGIDLLSSQIIPPQTKVIIATARGDIQDRVKGFDLGVDSYLVKPIALEELASIIHNFVRKSRSNQIHNQWTLDTHTWLLYTPNQQKVKLTASELKVLKRLSESLGHPVAKADIVEALGADVEAYDYRRLEVLIRRFRKKVETETLQILPITTARNIGYALTEVIDVK